MREINYNLKPNPRCARIGCFPVPIRLQARRNHGHAKAASSLAGLAGRNGNIKSHGLQLALRMKGFGVPDPLKAVFLSMVVRIDERPRTP